MRPIAFLLTLLLSLPVLADRVDVIELRHRTANEVAPVLRDTLPSTSIQAFNNQLIIKSPDNATYEQVLALIDQLDTAQRNLVVTVEQRQGQSRSGAAMALDGVVISNRGIGAGIRLFGGGSNSYSGGTQSVRVLDGGQAYIRLGSSRFYPEIGFGYRDGYAIAIRGGSWVDAGTGFWAQPRLVGGDVMLTLYPESSRFERDGSIASSGVHSEVRGRLGEWLPVGSSALSGSASSVGTVSGSGTRASSYTVWVKVDEAP
ncbi:MAG TPA: secretin N-terminal domain-containing protein [Chitinolyticbacter sp.]|nr:secretin N-terminal domain-containing protein [Chitinolyticbacter sp.]